jgi:hypothetical protein
VSAAIIFSKCHIETLTYFVFHSETVGNTKKAEIQNSFVTVQI